MGRLKETKIKCWESSLHSLEYIPKLGTDGAVLCGALEPATHVFDVTFLAPEHF